MDDDDSVIDTTEVEYGTTPVHADAAKAATAEYTYTFNGWTPAVEAVTGDATYKATYTQTANTYTITFNTDGGSAVASITDAYDKVIPEVTAPTKEGYTFE